MRKFVNGKYVQLDQPKPAQKAKAPAPAKKKGLLAGLLGKKDETKGL